MPDKVEKVNFGQIGPPPTLRAPHGKNTIEFSGKTLLELTS